MSAFPPAPRAPGCVSTGRCFSCRLSGSSFRPFRAGRVRVSASPPATPQLGNPDVCLPPGSVFPQPRGLFFGSSGLGGLSCCPAAWRNTGANYLGTWRPFSPTAWSCGGQAPCGRPAPCLPLRESALKTVRKTEQCGFFSGGGLYVSWVPGACLAIRVFDSGKPPGCLMVGFPEVCLSGRPTFAPLGSARQSALR